MITMSTTGFYVYLTPSFPPRTVDLNHDRSFVFTCTTACWAGSQLPVRQVRRALSINPVTGTCLPRAAANILRTDATPCQQRELLCNSNTHPIAAMPQCISATVTGAGFLPVRGPAGQGQLVDQRSMLLAMPVHY